LPCPQRDLRDALPVLPRPLEVWGDFDLVESVDGRVDLTTEQVDLGAVLVHQPLVPVNLPAGVRVDQHR
jgi:hypothetical protein